MPIDCVPLIREIGRGAHGARDLDRDRMRDLFAAMLDGEVAVAQANGRKDYYSL